MIAVVSGAASGIGRATVELLREQGWEVLGADIVEKADLQLDVRTVEGNERLVEEAVSRFGGIDAAVLNAGIPPGSPPLEAEGALERFEELAAIHLRAIVLGMRAVLPALRTRKSGAVVVTASVSGLAGDPGYWANCALKAGAINLVRSAALDYAATGIRINAVCPGPVHTPLTSALVSTNPTLYEAIRRNIPMQRWGEPREVAALIAFLISSSASFLTGLAIPADGGITASAGQFPLPTGNHSDG